jgi:hypothetical protein
MRKHRLYQVYMDMIYRCHDPNHPAYRWYGARGITVCSEWREDRSKFFDWALREWKQGFFLDRENNDQGYSPLNCHWITRKESNLNRRCVRLDLPSAAVIYDLASASVNQSLIGALYGITSRMVSRIKVGKSWQDAPSYLSGAIQ